MTFDLPGTGALLPMLPARLREDILSFLDLQEGWCDGEGGLMLRAQSDLLLGLLEGAWRESYRPLRATPSADGSILLSDDEVDVWISFHPDDQEGQIFVVLTDGEDATFHLGEMQAALDRVQ